MDSIDKIIENPGAFVGHLIDAVKLGFKQFGANFWTHLKDGLVQWLFGTFAQAGIRMPASFDIAGIFDLVCQVLGLTWPRLRGKVVKIIGEKNTERLEFVAQYLQALVTGGFAGLWEKIQQDMSSLWDMVVGGIKDWIIQKVVQQAILKIATMWNPAGAIIQLIETAWNVYQWVRENAQRIFGLVQAVVDSISNIVAGNIGGAANFIEASLARLVPVAISLFANLIGLGGIADQIRGIIEKVQAKVDQAIDKLIDRVMAMFKGKGGREKDDKEVPGEAERQQKIEQARAALTPHLARGVSKSELDSILASLKSTLGFKEIVVQKTATGFAIKATINPAYDVIDGKVIDTKTKKEVDVNTVSGNTWKAIARSLGLGHADSDHGPDTPDEKLRSIARSEGRAGKLATRANFIAAAELAKRVAGNAERQGTPLTPGKAYSVPVPPEWVVAYQKKASQPEEAGEPEVGFALEGQPAASGSAAESDGVQRMPVAKVRFILTRETKGLYNIKSIYPPVEGADEDVSRFL